MSFVKSQKKKGISSFFKNVSFFAPAFLLTFSYLLFDFHIIGLIFFSPERIFQIAVTLCLFLIPIFFAIELFIKDKSWSSLVLYLVTLILFTSSEYFKAIFISSVLLIFIWAISIHILKKKPFTIQQYLRIATAIPLLAFLVVSLHTSGAYLEPNWDDYTASLPDHTKKITLSSPVKETSPDIYYIVLDGYGREDILNKYYGYDNSSFIKKMQGKGFIIPVDAHANYARTVLSITSTLNMNYISEVIGGTEESKFWWLAKPFIEQSLARISLEEIGYKSVTIATDWDLTNSPNVDLYLKPRPIHLTDYEGYLFEKSILRLIYPWIDRFIYIPSNDSHRDLIEFSFEKIADVAKDPDPTFLFAHIVAPHPPFVFDKRGNKISPDYSFTLSDASDFPGTKEDYRTGYVEQVQHINHLIEETVKVILAQSDTPPIIILQGDHGPGMLTDFSSIENTCLQERFPIFAAYYLPNFNSEAFPEGFTPVNLFRLIFNEYFSADLPLLHNSSYFENKMIYIYDTVDITANLKSEQNNACKISPP